MERRKYRRVRQKIKVMVKEKHENALYLLGQGEAVDLSAGGVLFDYPTSFELNMIINLRFLEPGALDFFESDARIVRTEINPGDSSYSIGVEFINITAERMQKLTDFLAGIPEQPQLQS